MKKICICVLVLLAICSKAYASIPAFRTITPINLTIGTFERIDEDEDTRAKFIEAIRHFAVAVHEMTNGAHQLGRIKVVQKRNEMHSEIMHINWERGFVDYRGMPRAEAWSIGSYIPFSQNTDPRTHGIRIDHSFLSGVRLGDGFADHGPIDTGYVLAHEVGHFIYGLFDEYYEGIGAWINRWQPWPGDSLAFSMTVEHNSIMARQKESIQALQGRDSRARGLNFSTRFHYDYPESGAQFQTAQRRMFEHNISGWSGWDILVSNARANTWEFRHRQRSQFLDLIDMHPNRHPARLDPEQDQPFREMIITHTRGFPNAGADEERFNYLSKVAMNSLNIEFGTTDNQRARLFILGGDFIETVDLRPHLTLEELAAFGRTSVQFSYFNNVSSHVNLLTADLPPGSHIGLFALDNRRLHSIVPLGGIENTSITGRINDAITTVRNNSTNVPLLSRVAEAIPLLQEYMYKNGVILGDIVVLLGQMSRHPSDIPLSGDNSNTDNSLDRISRLHFIPITIYGFNVNNQDMLRHREIATNTGGTSGRAIVPANPENIRLINNVVARELMPTNPSMSPWYAHRQFIAVGRAGSIGPAAISTSFETWGVETLDSTMWQLVSSGNETPFYQSMAPVNISPASIVGSSFHIDSTYKSFLAQLSIRNPFRHALEVVFIDPSGTEHHVPIPGGASALSADTVASFNVDPSNPGNWRPVLRGAGQGEATLNYTIVGITHGLFESDEFFESPTGRPFKGSISANIDVANEHGGIFDRSYGGETFVTVTTNEGRHSLANLSVVVQARLPDGRVRMINVNDGGVWPDEMARDGVFTGTLDLSDATTGQVVITALVSNLNGAALPTHLMDRLGDIWDLNLDEAFSFFGEPMTEPFTRQAQITFDIVGNVPAAPEPLPEFETFPMPLIALRQISGPEYLLPGIDVEYSVDISFEGLEEPLARFFEWTGSSNLIITPDPDGRANVVRVRANPDLPFDGASLQVRFTAPLALREITENQTRSLNLGLAEPLFEGTGFNNQVEDVTIFVNEEAFFNMELVMPAGHDSSASWSITANPDNAGYIVSQSADGVTLKGLRPGMFTITLASDVFPDEIRRSFEIRSVYGESGIPVQGVTIAPATASIAVGSTQQLTANIIPTNATNLNVTWSSANTNAATVDENGLVTAVSPGSSVISVTTADGGFTAQSTITVTSIIVNIPVESIAVTPATLTLNQSSQGSLSVAFTPANATNRAVIWSTSNSAVATVNNGTVTAHGAGSAVITATSVDGSRTSTSTVTVTGGSGSDPRRERYEQRFPGHNIIFAPDGGGKVVGNPGPEVIVSGPGTGNWLEGGPGNTIYVYNRDADHDVIYNGQSVDGDINELHFGPDIALEDLVFYREGNDLIILVLDEYGEVGGSVTVRSWYLANRFRLARIVFYDDTYLTTEEIEALVTRIVRGTAANQTLRANSQPGERVRIYATAGTNTIFAGQGVDEIVIGTGSDIINARSHIEGGGQKTFIWNVGAGNATIFYLNADRQAAGDGLSILEFGSGVGPENIDVQINGNNVVFVVTVGDKTSRISISGSRNEIGRRMDEIRFADGTVWTWYEAMERPRIVRGTEANQTLRANSQPGERVRVYSTGGTNTIFAGHGVDEIVIGTGSDVINARSHIEGGGQKTFIWNVGAGNATIHYLNVDRQAKGDGLSILKFGPGVAPESINVQFTGNHANFVITVGGVERRITFSSSRHEIGRQMDEIRFADGAVWNWADFVRR